MLHEEEIDKIHDIIAVEINKYGKNIIIILFICLRKDVDIECQDYYQQNFVEYIDFSRKLNLEYILLNNKIIYKTCLNERN